MKKKVLEDFGITLIDSFTPEQVELITNKLILVLNGYDIVKTSTDLVVYDNGNEELMKRYVACLLLDGKSQKTCKTYIAELKRFLQMFPKNLTEVTTIDVRSYFASQMSRGVSKRTISNSKNFLSSFFLWLKKEGEIETNPIEQLNAIKYEKEIKEPFTDIEIDKMRSSNLSVRDRAIFEVLISSGIRVSELCNLNREDIDLQSMKVHVKCGKGAKDRYTFISKVAAHRLQQYLETRKDTNPAMFLTMPNRGSEYQTRILSDSVRFILREIGKRSGVSDIHPHKFRHTFATSMYNKGMDLHEIQQLLGHSSIQTTLIYISTNDFKLEQSYKKFIA